MRVVRLAPNTYGHKPLLERPPRGKRVAPTVNALSALKSLQELDRRARASPEHRRLAPTGADMTLRATNGHTTAPKANVSRGQQERHAVVLFHSPVPQAARSSRKSSARLDSSVVAKVV
jgi:hypothetical protein